MRQASQIRAVFCLLPAAIALIFAGACTSSKGSGVGEPNEQEFIRTTSLKGAATAYQLQKLSYIEDMLENMPTPSTVRSAVDFNGLTDDFQKQIDAACPTQLDGPLPTPDANLIWHYKRGATITPSATCDLRASNKYEMTSENKDSSSIQRETESSSFGFTGDKSIFRDHFMWRSMVGAKETKTVRTGTDDTADMQTDLIMSKTFTMIDGTSFTITGKKLNITHKRSGVFHDHNVFQVQISFHDTTGDKTFDFSAFERDSETLHFYLGSTPLNLKANGLLSSLLRTQVEL